MKRLLFTCIGTRGDVEPCLAVADAIASTYKGQYHITVATHAEFMSMVLSRAAVDRFLLIEPSLKSASESELGLRVRAATNSLFSMDLAAIRGFLYAQNNGWFSCLRDAIDSNDPYDVLFLGLLGCLSGFPAYIKSLPVERQPRVCVLNTFPLVTTGEFTSPTSGLPVSLAFAWLNRLSWAVESWIKHESFDVPLMKRLCEQHGVPFWPEHGSVKSAIADVPGWAVFHVFSPALLPTPADWPRNHSVIGFLSRDVVSHQNQNSQSAGANSLPKDLQAFLDASQDDNALVLYLCFGSMLPMAFASEVHAGEVLQVMCNGLVRAAASHAQPLRFVVHSFPTQTDGFCMPGLAVGSEDQFFILRQPISHSALLPQVDFVMQHGGVGTLQASILHGCVPIVFPCMVGVDQSFWAGVVQAKGLGVYGGWAASATPTSVSQAVTRAIQGMEAFQDVGKHVSRAMREDEDPVARIMEWMNSG